MYDKFLDNFTDFIFIEDEPERSDIIFVPGNGYPEPAERAAELWKKGYAPKILPSGKHSILKDRFEENPDRETSTDGGYDTEWDFMHDILIRCGVPEKSILQEKEATYTYENAIFSRKVTDRERIRVRRGMICCLPHHARRCRMYYQLLFPDAQLLVCPAVSDISRGNWMKTEQGIDAVLGEMERCGSQFHKILRDL